MICEMVVFVLHVSSPLNSGSKRARNTCTNVDKKLCALMISQRYNVHVRTRKYVHFIQNGEKLPQWGKTTAVCKESQESK